MTGSSLSISSYFLDAIARGRKTPSACRHCRPESFCASGKFLRVCTKFTLKSSQNIAPLHQGQLRSMVGFPSTWLEINPSRLDFQPLVRNPTAGWYSTHWMVRIPTILPLCIFNFCYFIIISKVLPLHTKLLSKQTKS